MPASTSSNGVNTARVVRAAATVPEVCFHNVKLGQGCFCPHCPTAHFPVETSAFRGLKSISYRPDLPLVDLVMTFDSMEAAQVARERVTALVMPSVEPFGKHPGAGDEA